MCTCRWVGVAVTVDMWMGVYVCLCGCVQVVGGAGCGCGVYWNTSPLVIYVPVVFYITTYTPLLI